MRKRMTVRFCDYPECEVYSTIEDNKIRLDSKGEGDWCIDHFPYPHCSVCNKPMRPYQAKLDDWPGTVARGSSNPPRCMTHAVMSRQRKENTAFGHNVYPVDPVKALAVQKYINKTYPSDYDFLVKTLGVQGDYSRYEQQ